MSQPLVDDTKLGAVRLKLEEKRRHIEKEKRRIEAQMSKQLQKVGKAAFLQAINKRVRRGFPVVRMCLIFPSCSNVDVLIHLPMSLVTFEL